jgi:hypothetical protein
VTKKQNDLADVDEVDGRSVERQQKTAEHRLTASVKRPTNSALISTTAMTSRSSVHRVKRVVDEGQHCRKRKLLKRSQAKELRNDPAVAESVQMTNPNHLVGAVVVREEAAVVKLLRSSRIFPVGRMPSRRWRLSLLGPITPYAALHVAGARVVDVRDC